MVGLGLFAVLEQVHRGLDRRGVLTNDEAFLFAARDHPCARGEIDVAGEHLASHAVLRRLSAAFDAAATARLRALAEGFTPADAARVKEIERVSNLTKRELFKLLHHHYLP